MPPQEASCASVRKRLMSGPISASSISASRLSTPGIVWSSSISREKGRELLDLRRQRRDRLVEEVDLREHLPDEQRVVAAEAALQRFAQRRDLLTQRALGKLGRGSRGRWCR
jgi:hypothetical protein